jgi:hypothetical protein
MDKLELNSHFNASTPKEKFQLDHIWTNVFGNECKLGVIEAYWPYFHKPIYVAFKLPNTLPIINVFIYLKNNICNYMCGYMMHFPFGHPKIISSSIISKCCIIYCMWCM